MGQSCFSLLTLEPWQYPLYFQVAQSTYSYFFGLSSHGHSSLVWSLSVIAELHMLQVIHSDVASLDPFTSCFVLDALVDVACLPLAGVQLGPARRHAVHRRRPSFWQRVFSRGGRRLPREVLSSRVRRPLPLSVVPLIVWLTRCCYNTVVMPHTRKKML